VNLLQKSRVVIPAARLIGSLWEPLRKLDEVERPEPKRFPKEIGPNSSLLNAFWTPAFAGVTEFQRFARTPVYEKFSVTQE
jgi:hypothetical protein